jgi:hypothetical protein
MAKAKKVYTIRITSGGFRSSSRETSGTLEELIKYFKYTLEVGESYEYEKGNYKINTNPKSIKTLVSNLNKAAHNSGRSYQSEYYSLVEE